MISAKTRADFPALENNPGLIYLDSAATTLKPKSVIAAQARYYEEYPANVGRGSHKLSRIASEKYEESRETIASFAGAKQNEIVFTRNATESINLVATSLERQKYFAAGDEIVVSLLEHHANFVPWHQVCSRTGAKLKVVGLNPDYTIDMDDLVEKVTGKTKLVAIAHASNTVASIQPAKEITKVAHDAGALLMLDAAQSAPHFELNLRKIGADFAAFSSHKMLGPTGTGALYGTAEMLGKMQPYNYGGGMIKSVGLDKIVFADSPQKFEAGTPAIGEAIGFAEAVRYLKKIGMEGVREHEKTLTRRCIEKLDGITGLEMHCPKNPEKQGGIVLFGVDGIDAVDLAVALDESRKIAIRSGMHCAEPIVGRINPHGLCRASFYLYNTAEEIDAFAGEVAAIAKAFRQ